MIKYRRNKTRILLSGIFLLLFIFVLRTKFLDWYQWKSIPSNESRPNLSLAQSFSNRSVHSRSYSMEGMKEQAIQLNFQQRVVNNDVFGDHRADDPVIVIQVHDRPDLMKRLLNSLRSVQGIDSTTLIISRDKFTPELDQLIDRIEFCRYIEIFFPFAMQLYPDKFPGEDPNDCPRDLSKSQAKEKRCNNYEYPDTHGHYREVKFVQIKHHWFWKLNMVFSGLHEVHDNTGPILFLEDDNFVAPDLIDIMRKMLILHESECKHCLMTLGAYDFSTDYKIKGKIVDIIAWQSTKHNIGMIIDNTFYKKLLDCQEYFCTYDDYNWDWSLQSTAVECLPNHLFTMVLKVPRVYHLGCTGFHQKKNGNCDIGEETSRLNNLFASQSDYLFPRILKLESNNQSPNRPHQKNGGWGDIRDHALCKSYRKICESNLSIS